MKKTVIFLLLAALVATVSCGRRDEYRIHGRVTSNELEGIQVFLVPLGHEEPWNVDSVKIRNHEFFFKGREHWMCEIRLDKYNRDKGQNLLVATEPGDIYVTIGPDSSGGGTPQNDSLQVWKNITIENGKVYGAYMNAGMKAQADSARAAYRERTRQMAFALGEDSIGGEFLLKLYPPVKK